MSQRGKELRKFVVLPKSRRSGTMSAGSVSRVRCGLAKRVPRNEAAQIIWRFRE